MSLNLNLIEVMKSESKRQINNCLAKFCLHCPPSPALSALVLLLLWYVVQLLKADQSKFQFQHSFAIWILFNLLLFLIFLHVNTSPWFRRLIAKRRQPQQLYHFKRKKNKLHKHTYDLHYTYTHSNTYTSIIISEQKQTRIIRRRRSFSCVVKRKRNK